MFVVGGIGLQTDMSRFVYGYGDPGRQSCEGRYRARVGIKFEVDALGVIIISRGCFERCGSNKKTPP